MRASVRRQGEWYNLNYSYQLGYGAQLVASRLVSKMLRDFQSISENILQDGEREEAFGLIRQARRVVQSGFDGLLEKCQLAGKAIHVGEMKYDTKLWSDCDNEWGKGQGYRDRVVDHHVKWFLHYNHFHEKDFQTLIEKEWQETLDRLSAILDEVLTE